MIMLIWNHFYLDFCLGFASETALVTLTKGLSWSGVLDYRLVYLLIIIDLLVASTMVQRNILLGWLMKMEIGDTVFSWFFFCKDGYFQKVMLANYCCAAMVWCAAGQFLFSLKSPFENPVLCHLA